MDDTVLTPLPEKTVKSRNMVFPVDRSVLNRKLIQALKQQGYEQRETNCVLRTVRDDDTVIELGGGIGYMSTLLSTRRKLRAIHTFEANPRLIPYIQRVHALNGVENAVVHNAVLGPRKGKTTFYVRKNLLASSLQPREDTVVVSEEKIDMLNAKHAFRDFGANVLVADIEGGEVDLIPRLDLTELRAAVIELHPQWIGVEGVNTVFQAFINAGMAYYHRGSHGKVVAFRRAW